MTTELEVPNNPSTRHVNSFVSNHTVAIRGNSEAFQMSQCSKAAVVINRVLECLSHGKQIGQKRKLSERNDQQVPQ